MIAYCDYIANSIRDALHNTVRIAYPAPWITTIGNIQWDLAEDGSFGTTKKTLKVVDFNGKEYQITVEEL